MCGIGLNVHADPTAARLPGRASAAPRVEVDLWVEGVGVDDSIRDGGGRKTHGCRDGVAGLEEVAGSLRAGRGVFHRCGRHSPLRADDHLAAAPRAHQGGRGGHGDPPLGHLVAGGVGARARVAGEVPTGLLLRAPVRRAVPGARRPRRGSHGIAAGARLALTREVQEKRILVPRRERLDLAGQLGACGFGGVARRIVGVGVTRQRQHGDRARDAGKQWAFPGASGAHRSVPSSEWRRANPRRGERSMVISSEKTVTNVNLCGFRTTRS